MEIEFILFLAVAALIIIIATNFTHWVHVIRYKRCRIGSTYSGPIKGDKTKAVVTDKKDHIIWYKLLHEDGTYSDETFANYDEFFFIW